MNNFELDKLNFDAWEQRMLDIKSSYKNSLELLTLSEAQLMKKVWLMHLER